MVDTLHRIKSVSSITGLSRSQIYNKINPRSDYYDPEFPKPISLGARAKAWPASALQQYITKQIEKSKDGREVA